MPIEDIRGRARVIAINDGWKLTPWAELLYACDFAWWQKYGGVPEFGGLRVTADKTAARRPWGIHLVTVIRNDDRLELLQPGRLGWGGNSGFQCLNLAVQLGARKIILVGFDLRVDRGIHWHGPHVGLNNPTARNVARWCRAIDGAADQIAAMGIKVINCSAISALQNYDKKTLSEAIAC